MFKEIRYKLEISCVSSCIIPRTGLKYMGTYWPWHWGLCSQCVLSHFSHAHLSDSMDCRLPGSSVHGILQARTLEWVVMPSSRVYFRPRDQTHIGCNSCTAEGFFTTEPLGKPRVEGSVQFSHSIMSTLCDPMDCRLPGSSVHGILQVRILEWIAMPSSRDLPNPGIKPASVISTCIDRWILYH